MRFAMTGPIPSSESKSPTVARLILIGPLRFGVATRTPLLFVVAAST